VKLAGRRRDVERRGLLEHIQGYLMGAITGGSPMIGPSLFKAQTAAWVLFDSYGTIASTDSCRFGRASRRGLPGYLAHPRGLPGSGRCLSLHLSTKDSRLQRCLHDRGLSPLRQRPCRAHIDRAGACRPRPFSSGLMYHILRLYRHRVSTRPRVSSKVTACTMFFWPDTATIPQ